MHGGHFFAAHTFCCRYGLEVRSFAARHTLLGAYPEETILVLAQGEDPRAGKSLFQRKGAQIVLLGA